MAKRAGAIIQIIVVLLIIVYGTVSLFMGNFEGMYVTFPVLLIYYVYVVARQKRRQSIEDRNDSEH